MNIMKIRKKNVILLETLSTQGKSLSRRHVIITPSPALRVRVSGVASVGRHPTITRRHPSAVVLHM